MEREERYSEKLDRLERALRSAHLLASTPPPLAVDAVMARVRLAEVQSRNDLRFVWRFLSAASVAAILLLAVTLWNDSTPDTLALNQALDSPWTILVGSSVLN